MSLSVIHLSDIHIENKNDEILKRLDKIKDACISVLPHNSTVLIIVSGDIANKGKAEQYVIAKQFFDELKSYIENNNNSKVILVFTPGNHDCDFELDSSVRKVLIDSVKNKNIDQDVYSNIVCVQAPYFNFVNKYNNYDLNKIINTIEFEINNEKILVISANTAWMSKCHENPGEIVMPENLLNKENIELNNYSYIFYVFHHPTNWLYPDKKKSFIKHLRESADFIFLGHEHERDSYLKTNENFSIIFSHGKELQNREYFSSSFSVYLFNDKFNEYSSIDYTWKNDKYIREKEKTDPIQKNKLLHRSVSCPNSSIIEYCEDLGVTLNHFAKENATLSDLFVYPDICRYVYGKYNNTGLTIRNNTLEHLNKNKLSVIIGTTSQGKTTLSKHLLLTEENTNNCCILLNGTDFTSSNPNSITNTIEETYKKQYSSELLESFRQLQIDKKIIIIDNFDYIKNNNNRRITILDHLAEQFGKIIIFLSSDIELASIIQSKLIKSFNSFYYYELLPLGNIKRRQLISKWYHLENHSQTEDEINTRIENAENCINAFLGNNAHFIPAIPLFVLSTLQNIDAKNTTYKNTKFGFLYESLIKSSIAKSANNDYDTSKFDMDSYALSLLAYNMLKSKKTSFIQSQLKESVRIMNEKYILDESPDSLLERMTLAKIIYKDPSEGECYRFKYPYIFYYFAGMYIAEHLNDTDVKKQTEYMSSKLYNETYGNIMIFVCHFANNKEVIDNILLNAYSTFENNNEFEFTKTNPIFDEIKESLKLIIPKSIATNSEIPKKQEEALKRKDEAGITDGQLKKEEEYIDDEITEKEQEMANVASAFKTMEVLGQILKNYPTKVDGNDKIIIIDEIHSLGMRSINVLINTIIDYKSELIDYVYYKTKKSNKEIKKEKVIESIQRFCNAIVSGTARSMIHQIAKTLDNEHLLEAATISLSKNTAISAKLVLLDLKLNCLKKCNYNEIKQLRKTFIESNELFATCILDSIVGYYLNYNKCNYQLKSKLCSLCEFSEKNK